MKLRIVLNIALSVLLLIGAVEAVRWMQGHQQKPAQKQPEKMPPRVLAPPIKPRLQQHVKIIDYGSARPKVQLDITPQVSGIIVDKAPNFLSGNYVSRGQILFRVDQTDYELAVQRAQKTIELFKTQLDRLDQEEKNLRESLVIETERRDLSQSQLEKVTRLLQRGAASDNELDLAREALLTRQAQVQSLLNQLALIQPQRAQLQAEIASSEVELRQVQTELDRCLVKSPVNGLVLSCPVEVGEQVISGAVCGQLYGTEIMEVPVSIPAADLKWIDESLLDSAVQLSTVSPDRRIEAIVEWTGAGDGQTITWRGFVERIEAGLEAETRTRVLVVQVKNPSPKGFPLSTPDEVDTPMLEVNMFCKVTVLGRRLAEAYILPRRAILPSGNVYVVIDGKLQMQSVKIARFAGQETMILPDGGLRQGQRVVISTIPKPVIGMTVQAMDTLESKSDLSPKPSESLDVRADDGPDEP